jgi:transposase
MPRSVGLDLHKRVLEVCIVDEQGAIVGRERLGVSRAEIVAFAERSLLATDRVAVEATTNTWAVAELLRPYVAEVVVSNPLKTRAIAEAKIKTDKVDAHTLAQLLRTDYLPLVWQPDPATARIRQLTSRRASLVSDRTAIKNRLHAVLHQRLLSPPVERLFSARGLEWLQTVELDDDGRAAVDSDLRLLAGLELEIAQIEAVLVQAVSPDPRVKLLLTLPGVDLICATSLLAALGELSRFKDADHAASYIGLAPLTKQSARRTYHGPITKAGNSHARWVLVQAAQHLDKQPGPLGVFFRRIARKKNRNVAVVATARKLVVIAYHLLAKNEPYRYAQPRPTAEKLRRLRIRATGARRRTGNPKGTKSVAKLPGGSRTIKPLPQLYAEEGLPALGPAAPGEQRMIRQQGVARFVASLELPQVGPRRRVQSGSDLEATQ